MYQILKVINYITDYFKYWIHFWVSSFCEIKKKNKRSNLELPLRFPQLNNTRHVHQVHT